MKRSALPPPDLGLKNSTGRLGARRVGQRHVHAEGGTRRRQRHQEPCHDQQLAEQRAVPGEQQRHRAGERQAGDGQPGHARRSPPQNAVPGRRGGDHDAGQQPQAARELAHRDGDTEYDCRGPDHQSGDRREPPPIHRITPP